MNNKSLFNNVNVFYLILIILIIWSTSYYVGNLADSQDNWKDRLNSVDDMKKCQHTAEYFSDFQSTFQSYPIGMLSGALCSIAMILIVVGVKVSAPNMKLVEIAPVLVFIAFFMGFISSYKVANCMLGRMCGGIPCSRPFFAGPSPA